MVTLESLEKEKQRLSSQLTSAETEIASLEKKLANKKERRLALQASLKTNMWSTLMKKAQEADVSIEELIAMAESSRKEEKQ